MVNFHNFASAPNNATHVCLCSDFMYIEDKAYSVHAIKAYRGSRGIDQIILNFSSHICRFTPGKEHWHLLNRMLCGSQNRSGRFAERKYSFACPHSNPKLFSPLTSHNIHYTIRTTLLYVRRYQCNICRVTTFVLGNPILRAE